MDSILEETPLQQNFGFFSSCFAFMVYMCPLVDVLRIMDMNTRASVAFPLQLLASILNCAALTLFGLVAPNMITVMTLNGMGVVILFSHLAIHFYYGGFEKKVRIGLFLSVEVICLGVTAFGAFSVAETPTSKTRFMGIVCIVAALLACIPPLMAVCVAYKTKRHAHIRIEICICSILSAASWGFYAHLYGNLYSMITNTIGFLINTIQVITFIKYHFFAMNPEAEAREVEAHHDI